jgi:hypothetical protein
MGVIVLLVGVLVVQTPVQRITTGCGARVRAQPGAQGKEMLRLGLGTVLTVTGEKTVGDATWHHITATAPVAVDGWIIADLTTVFLPGKREETYAALARARLNVKDAPWADDKDSVDFLTRAATEVKDPEVLALLDLTRLLLAQRAVTRVGKDGARTDDEMARYASKVQDAVYDETGGAWMVPAMAFWKAHDRHARTSHAEALAFEASRAPAPGECEGFMGCALQRAALMEGRYLKTYPAGAHAADVMAALNKELAQYTGDGADFTRQSLKDNSSKEENADVRRLLKELEEDLGATRAPGRDTALKHLATLKGWVPAKP